MDCAEKNFEPQMQQQLQGFRSLDGFRRFGYRAALVAAFIAGSVSGYQEGFKPGVVTAFWWAIFGIGGTRLLTAPIGAFLWYRYWKCPACGKRLGRSIIENCSECGAKLFSYPKGPSPDEKKS